MILFAYKSGRTVCCRPKLTKFWLSQRHWLTSFFVWSLVDWKIFFSCQSFISLHFTQNLKLKKIIKFHFPDVFGCSIFFSVHLFRSILHSLNSFFIRSSLLCLRSIFQAFHFLFVPFYLGNNDLANKWLCHH